MRLYQSAWNKLKSDPTKPLVISAGPHLHARIYKAIIKEKNIDTVFHLETAESQRTSKLSKRSDGNALVITLTFVPTVEGLF